MHRLLPILGAAAAVAVAACTDRNLPLPTELDAAIGASPTGDHAPIARPAGGRCQTDFTLLAPTPDQPANVQRLVINSTCQLAHLGRTTGSSEQVVTFTELGSTITTMSIYTAASGDQLFASFTGTGSFPDAGGVVAFQGTETYLGGTGRFVGASGSATVGGSASVVTRTGSFEALGTLRY